MRPQNWHLLLGLCVGLATACGSEPAANTVQGVVHLDPRLETPSGLVPAAPALFDQRQVVQEWTFAFGGWPAAWGFDNAELGDTPFFGGQPIRPIDRKGPDMGLVYQGELDARVVTVIEVELSRRQDSRATMTWQVQGSEKLFRAVGQRVIDGRITRLRFELTGDPGWVRGVHNLRLHPSSGWNQPIEMLGLRFLSEPFSYGGDPTDPTGVQSGDGGMLGRDGLELRSWPLSLGSTLTTQANIPSDGLLSFHAARGINANLIESQLVVSIMPTGKGKPLQKTIVLPVDQSAWVAQSIDVSGFAGQAVRIDFRAEVTAKNNNQAEFPPRTDVLIGNPMVLGQLPKDRRPNIILVTSDTTRFDAFGSSHDGDPGMDAVSGRAERVFTPFLDELAADGLVFTNAWSMSNSTQPSHASIMTGLTVQDHSLADNYGILGAGADTLAEALRAAGYQTAAATCKDSIATRAGFGQGFDVFFPPGPNATLDGGAAVAQAAKWIGEWSAERERPFFLWVHVFDPHTPYELPEGELEPYIQAKGPLPDPVLAEPTLPNVIEIPPEMAFLEGVNNHAYAESLYHAEVAYTDRLMAELFGAVRKAGLTNHTVEIVTADHGESLGERSNYFNHRGLYPETLHVPLIMRVPGIPGGERIDARVSNRDLKPTLLALLGLEQPPKSRNLLERVGGERIWFEHANSYVLGCRDDEYHFSVVLRDNHAFGLGPVPGSDFVAPVPRPMGTVELYDWRTDPGLERNLADERPEVVERYLALVDAYRASANPVGSEKRAMSAEEEAEMTKLGYTGD